MQIALWTRGGPVVPAGLAHACAHTGMRLLTNTPAPAVPPVPAGRRPRPVRVMQHWAGRGGPGASRAGAVGAVWAARGHRPGSPPAAPRLLLSPVPPDCSAAQGRWRLVLCTPGLLCFPWLFCTQGTFCTPNLFSAPQGHCSALQISRSAPRVGSAPWGCFALYPE